jgi:hypothetical protein
MNDKTLTKVHPEVSRFFRWSGNGLEWSGTLIGAIIGGVAALIAAWVAYIRQATGNSN